MAGGNYWYHKPGVLGPRDEGHTGRYHFIAAPQRRGRPPVRRASIVPKHVARLKWERQVLQEIAILKKIVNRAVHKRRFGTSKRKKKLNFCQRNRMKGVIVVVR